MAPALDVPLIVMPALVPGIHLDGRASPGMTTKTGKEAF
jgi:hypothetical protein